MVMKEVTINEEQLIQYEILKYFVGICEKENLHFFLAYGTLLGAVREKGFIDWDDDVDIWMKRSEYDKFLKVFEKYQNESFFLQTFETDPKCLATGLARICVNNTEKWPTKFKKCEFHRGIYFDIFPLDNGYGDWRDTYYTFMFKTYQALLLRKAVNNSRYEGKSLIKKVFNFILYNILSDSDIRKRINQIIRIYKNNKQSNTLITFSSAFAGKCRTVFERSFFSDYVFKEFVGLNMPCPIRYDELLSYMYGNDYMIPIKTKPSYTPARIDTAKFKLTD